MAFCTSCGAPLAAGVAFCTSCGSPASVAPPAPQPYAPPPQAPAYGYGLGPAPTQSRKGIAIVLVIIVIAVAALGAFVAFGGGFGGSGTCVGVSWNGSYYDYTRVYGYSEAACDQWCSEHSFGTNCYWEP